MLMMVPPLLRYLWFHSIYSLAASCSLQSANVIHRNLLCQWGGLLFHFILSHPQRPRGSQLGREKGHDKSFQALIEEPLGTESHWTISKRSSECWLLIGLKKCFVLLCQISEQFLLSSFREFVHDGYCLATVAQFIHQAFLTRNKGTTKTFWMLSAGGIQFALRKFCFWQITMYRK